MTALRHDEPVSTAHMGNGDPGAEERRSTLVTGLILGIEIVAALDGIVFHQLLLWQVLPKWCGKSICSVCLT